MVEAFRRLEETERAKASNGRGPHFVQREFDDLSCPECREDMPLFVVIGDAGPKRYSQVPRLFRSFTIASLTISSRCIKPAIDMFAAWPTGRSRHLDKEPAVDAQGYIQSKPTLRKHSIRLEQEVPISAPEPAYGLIRLLTSRLRLG